MEHEIKKSDDTIDIPISSNEVAENEILCQNCYMFPRVSSEDYLCRHCKTSGKLPMTELPIHNVAISSSDNSRASVRQFDIALPSVRYSGLELEEIALAMVPDLPFELKAEIIKISNECAHDIAVKDNPTFEALKVRAMVYTRIGAILSAIVDDKALKIIASAKPEARKKHAEYKATTKQAAISKALPKEAHLKHAATHLLEPFLEITSVPDESTKKLLKAFLDYVQAQATVDDIDQEWIAKILQSTKFNSLNRFLTKK